ncbi:hypothetical protein ACFVRR_11970 [Gottfriedia sp. NPDC057948]|uniref:hypothetical protein n=1 Tax=Gottfriedia sp. NPDC057948 TaxID=3346287 RepID=UPI0036DB6513
MGLSLEEFSSLTDSEKEAIISKTEQSFRQNGADFTIKSMSELPMLIENINDLIVEGKKVTC